VPDETPVPPILPIELSSVVTTLETLTRELTKNLNQEEVTEVVTDLCDRLRTIAGEKRGPNRPFSR
jgi:hypothetical protein